MLPNFGQKKASGLLEGSLASGCPVSLILELKYFSYLRFVKHTGLAHERPKLVSCRMRSKSI
jgi:hypothetical protein